MFRIIIGPAKLLGSAVARSTQTLGGFLVRMLSFVTQSPVPYYVALAFLSVLVATVFGLFVSRYFPRPLLIGLTILTALSIAAIVFVLTRPLKTEAAVYFYAEVAAYLIIFLLFAAPITIVGWLFRPKRVS